MEKERRRKYTTEFKQEAVRLITEEGYSIAETARNLDIKANMSYPSEILASAPKEFTCGWDCSENAFWGSRFCCLSTLCTEYCLPFQMTLVDALIGIYSGKYFCATYTSNN